jgi:hypothetical protein
VQCWGRNSFGESEPLPDVAFIDVSTSGYGVCGIREDDHTLECAGEQSIAGPSTVPLGTYLNVNVGLDAACAIRNDNGLEVCWGNTARNLWR